MSEQISVHPSKLRETGWDDYVLRFLFGGAITAFAGFLAATFGPAVGGLFLAFPAILPASVTLIQRHDDRQEAAIDSLGAAIGTIGLVGFALIVWTFASRGAAWLVLGGAMIVWLVVSIGLWWLVQIVRRSPSSG